MMMSCFFCGNGMHLSAVGSCLMFVLGSTDVALATMTCRAPPTEERQEEEHESDYVFALQSDRFLHIVVRNARRFVPIGHSCWNKRSTLPYSSWSAKSNRARLVIVQVDVSVYVLCACVKRREGSEREGGEIDRGKEKDRDR